MDKVNCPKFDNCNVPLCPLDESSIRNGIWYPGQEDICHRRGAPGWVKRQRAIVKTKAPSDKFFTVAMLQAITRIQKGIAGIDPNQPITEAKKEEQKWILAFQKRAKLQTYKPKGQRNSIAKKRNNLVFATNTSNQEIGGEL